MYPPGVGESKSFSNGPGHMTNISGTPIHVNPPPHKKKNLLLQNQMTYDLETWYAALLTQLLL